MLPSQQIHDGADTAYPRATSPAPGSWERSGWDQEPSAIETHRRPPDNASAVGATDTAPPKRRLFPGFWSRSLGFAGLVLGAAGAGVLAHQMGYDWRMTATIGALVGVAGGSAGVMLPLLLRAIGWAILAALVGIFGAAALYLLTRVAPVFVERFVG